MGAGKDVCHVIKTYWSLLLGNLLEWYEFCLFSFLEPYFEANFFQGSALAAWLGFAITFVARPFGGVALGLVGDVLGRKVSTFLSIFGMLCGTVLQGVLPTYKNGHVAGTLGLSVLILLRLLQGVCTGGEIAAVTTYLTEIGEPRSLSSSLLLVPVTATVGFFAGQLMTFSFEWFLGEEQMMDWGWRIPFLLALFPGLLATMGRRCIPESGLFLRAKEESEITSSKSATSRAISKTRELLASYWPQVLLGVGAVASVSVLQYGGISWHLVSLKKKGLSSQARIACAAGANALTVGLAPLVGWLGDRQGAAWVMMVTSAMMALLGMPLLLAMDAAVEQPEVEIGLFTIAFGILGALEMCHFLQVVELFPVDVRNAGVGLSYNLGVCLFGGFAPMAFEAAAATPGCGTWLPAALFAAGGLITATATLASLCLQSKGKIQLTHVRHEPYFRCWGRERFQCGPRPKEPAGLDEGEDVPQKEEFRSVVQL